MSTWPWPLWASRMRRFIGNDLSFYPFHLHMSTMRHGPFPSALALHSLPHLALRPPPSAAGVEEHTPGMLIVLPPGVLKREDRVSGVGAGVRRGQPKKNGTRTTRMKRINSDKTPQTAILYSAEIRQICVIRVLWPAFRGCCTAGATKQEWNADSADETD